MSEDIKDKLIAKTKRLEKMAEAGHSSLTGLVNMAKAMSEGDYYREANVHMRGELGKLADYINKTRQSLRVLDPTIRESSQLIPQASMQLSSITDATEKAAHKIMSIAEKFMEDRDIIAEEIENLRKIYDNYLVDKDTDFVENLQVIEDINEENRGELLEILTTLSFQDLTGQKIKKIVQLVDEIENKILELLVIFGIEMDENPEETLEKKREMLDKLQESKSSSDGIGQGFIDDILEGLGDDDDDDEDD